MGGGGSDVEYTQSPEQRMVYQALQPMVQRLGAQYAPMGQQMISPVSSQTGGSIPPGGLLLTPKELESWTRYGGQSIGRTAYGNIPIEFTYEILKDPNLANKFKNVTISPAQSITPTAPAQTTGQPIGYNVGGKIYYGTKEQVASQLPRQFGYNEAFLKDRITDVTPVYSQQATTTQPTIAGQPAIGGGLYNIPYPPQIPSPQIASPLAGYQMVAPQVQAGLWQPYQEAEKRLLDVMQSRGQLGAPGAGISGAAGGALSDFYSQAARDIGLSTYQMSLPFTQMAQAPLSQHWAAQTGQLGDVWSAQLAREMMPWQMLPGLLGGTYSTGIAQDKGFNFGGALAGGLTGTAMGMALAPATGGLSMAIPALMGTGGFLSGGK